QFGRQIFLSLSDGSLIIFDKLTFQACEQTYPLQKTNHLFTNRDKCECFVRIQRTSSSELFKKKAAGVGLASMKGRLANKYYQEAEQLFALVDDE
ncbi:unnamed protein product, partial [Didymodactylos carnosus]